MSHLPALRKSAPQFPCAQVIGHLPDEQSRVIELAYYGGFTHTEIAAMLDLPVGTVKGRMRLGLQKLRDELRGRELVP